MAFIKNYSWTEKNELARPNRFSNYQQMAEATVHVGSVVTALTRKL